MDKTTLKIVLFTFLGILVFNIIMTLIIDDRDTLSNLTSLNLPVIGVISLIIGLSRGKKDDDANQ